MAVLNVHMRRLQAPEAEAGALVDTLAGERDRLWPIAQWPPMRFDRPLSVGAIGGHGPIRYVVEEYQPGRRIRFRFTGPRGFDGFHEFSVARDSDGTVLHHLLAAHLRGPARLSWPLAYRWMHDALIEDSLDRAEHELTGSVRTPAQWSGYVRLLRALSRVVLKRQLQSATAKAESTTSKGVPAL